MLLPIALKVKIMEKKEIIKIFVSKKILSDKSNLIRRPFSWK